MSLVKTFCIGHQPPLFEVPISYQMLCPTSLGIPNEIVIEDNRFGLPIDGTSLAEYSQLFALADMLSAGEIVADNLYLFQYRKFISPLDGGTPANAPWIKILTPENSGSMMPTNEFLESLTSRVIVGSHHDFEESISANYARAHVIEDLVLFTASCAQNQLLTETNIKNLATLRGIIPSPALTFINVQLFIHTMEILKKSWDHFSQHYMTTREGYQRRSAGYLLERLHSTLLCDWLLNGSEPEIQLWNRYAIISKE